MPNTAKIPPHVVNSEYISILLPGRTFTLASSHPTFADLRTAITKGEWDKVPDLVTVADRINKEGQGVITIENGQILYLGNPMNTSLTRRILRMQQDNQPLSHMLKFMENLMKNPVQSAINELYDFMSRNDMPITDDGCFVAYKTVRDDFKDHYTGMMDNSPGKIVKMDRSACDTNRHKTCSRGLHFCAFSYLSSYGHTGHIVELKINPADVVSIPVDYGFAKGRAWQYEVVREVGRHKEVVAAKEDVLAKKAIEPVQQDRQTLLEKLLAHPVMKRNIKKGQIALSTIRKQTLGRLLRMWEKLPPIETEVEKMEKALGNPLKKLREEAGLSLADVAEELDCSKSAVWAAERSANAKLETIERYKSAISVLRKRGANGR